MSYQIRNSSISDAKIVQNICSNIVILTKYEHNYNRHIIYFSILYIQSRP